MSETTKLSSCCRAPILDVPDDDVCSKCGWPCGHAEPAVPAQGAQRKTLAEDCPHCPAKAGETCLRYDYDHPGHPKERAAAQGAPAEPPVAAPQATAEPQTEHMLKTWPSYFQAVLDGRKRFELRKNDRSYQIGDVLLLQEWNPETWQFSGRETSVRVDYLAQGVFGLPEDVCVMSITRLQPEAENLRPENATLRQQLADAQREIEQARELALEEACKAVCPLCAGANRFVNTTPVEAKSAARRLWIHHWVDGNQEEASVCKALDIRALLATQPATKEEQTQ